MTRPIVVDTCVAYKWLSAVGETAVEEALALLDARSQGQVVLVAPATMPVELVNALRYSGLQRDDILALVEDLDLSHVELFEVSSARLAQAATLAYRHGLSIYDALFLALAEELDCPLVTADRRAFGGIETGVEIRLL